VDVFYLPFIGFKPTPPRPPRTSDFFFSDLTRPAFLNRIRFQFLFQIALFFPPSKLEMFRVLSPQSMKKTPSYKATTSTPALRHAKIIVPHAKKPNLPFSLMNLFSLLDILIKLF